MMNLYLVENHVKYTMDAECKALAETAKQTKGKTALNANRYRCGVVSVFIFGVLWSSVVCVGRFLSDFADILAMTGHSNRKTYNSVTPSGIVLRASGQNI